jgi:hypothetical protein
MDEALAGDPHATRRRDEAAADVAERVEMLAERDRPARAAQRGHTHLVGPDQIMAARGVDIEQCEQSGWLLANELYAIAVTNVHDDLNAARWEPPRRGKSPAGTQ